MDLSRSLEIAAESSGLPIVLAYNRIDGPGSSLDLREFQQALWSLPRISSDPLTDPAVKWTRDLPRTIALTINTGTRIQAYPFQPGKICVRSIEYGAEVIVDSGAVPPKREYWLAKIIDNFGLSGLKITLHNLRTGIQSSGLGGSASATTGVCILANELAGRPFGPAQLISMASRMEHDLGVSITGTQEQANVLFGGVCDYIWFPWGVPGSRDTGFGESLRIELVPPEDYDQLTSRFAIYHSGRTRASTDVNAVWRAALSTPDGYALHRRKPVLAYEFREALRLRDWERALSAIREYRNVRTQLCPFYLDGASEILGFAEDAGGTAFPLGAGGGGGILVFAPKPSALEALRDYLSESYREIPFQISARGHKLVNLPLTV